MAGAPVSAGRAWPPAGAGRGAGGRGRTRGARLDVAEDVLLGDAAGDAGAGDLADVHVVLGRDLADDRRRAGLAQLVHGHLGARLLRGGRAPAAARGRGAAAGAGRCRGAERRAGARGRRSRRTARRRRRLRRRPSDCGAAGGRPRSRRRRRRRGRAGSSGSRGRRRGRGGAGGAERPRPSGAPAASPSAPMTPTTVLMATVVPGCDADLLQDARPRGRGSRRPPCRWRSRTAARRAGPCRRRSSSTW